MKYSGKSLVGSVARCFSARLCSAIFVGLAQSAIVILSPASSSALTLDSFEVEGVASSTVVGVSDTVVTEAPQAAIGGFRTLYAEKTGSGGGGTRLETFNNPTPNGDPNFSLSYTQGFHQGIGILTWDGENQGAQLSPNGLGQVDLTQDGGTALVLGLEVFDLPSGQPLDVTIRLYDGSDPSGERSSAVRIFLDQAVNFSPPFPLTIPFAHFASEGARTIQGPAGTSFSTVTSIGLGGPVDVTRVGAVRLVFNGQTNAAAPDLFLAHFTTNGRCTSVPNSEGRVLDECGVCLEDAMANQGRDSCGVCLAGPPGYNYTALFDQCGLCPTHPNYTLAQDPCGVCFGDGSSCADCSGVPNGAGQLDVCGVCNGNGTTCLDCAGAPFGSLSLDICGVCGGNGSSCTDCAGTHLGTASIDACGTCGGTVSDPLQCSNSCRIVPATRKIRGFERTLIQKANTLRTRFYDEAARANRNACGINLRPGITQIKRAYKSIRASGKSIFSSGIEVCGDSCITVSYSRQIRALTPKFRILERQASALANQVKQCYSTKGLASGQGTKGLASTITGVRDDLKQLIIDCRNTQVCPQ